VYLIQLIPLFHWIYISLKQFRGIILFKSVKAAVDVCPQPSADWPPTLTFRGDTYCLTYLPKESSYFKLMTSSVQIGGRTGLFCLKKKDFCYSKSQMRYFVTLSSVENVKRQFQYVLLELIISKSRHCLPCKGHVVSYPEVKRLRRGIDHPPPHLAPRLKK